ncbi:hypothetical protein N431DRAFT_354334 [Stipitochalara longipes BDJ]|nr:hypothetical protein N431DRAFT_354334 [Stipitochalara longipes BDJ]
MQAQSRGRGTRPDRAPTHPTQQQSQPPPQYQEEHPLHPPDIYYRYTEASTSLPTAHNQPFTPIYMAHNPSSSVPHHQHHQTQYASSITSASSPAPLSDAEAEAKRIRNTAASARFRRKKKAREASLERQSREKREALAKLENRISELEDENKFLKGLILWKREGREEEEGNEGKGKGVEESIVVEPERKGRERKDGVGT